MAAIRAGKHVYCQKPLTHTLHECRELTKAAHAAGVATQMGNQGHASEGARLTNEWIQAGHHRRGARSPRLVRSRGPALEARHRPSHGDAPRPLDAGLESLARTDPRAALSPGLRSGQLARLAGFRHRGAGRHGLPHHRPSASGRSDLGAPTAVEASATLDGSFLEGNKPNFETYPIASIITYEFPARGSLPPVRMTWYEGGLMPPTPAEMPPGQRLPGNGVLVRRHQGQDVPLVPRRHARAAAGGAA